jgi:hypothetical protein
VGLGRRAEEKLEGLGRSVVGGRRGAGTRDLIVLRGKKVRKGGGIRDLVRLGGRRGGGSEDLVARGGQERR